MINCANHNHPICAFHEKAKTWIDCFSILFIPFKRKKKKISSFRCFENTSPLTQKKSKIISSYKRAFDGELAFGNCKTFDNVDWKRIMISDMMIEKKKYDEENNWTET